MYNNFKKIKNKKDFLNLKIVKEKLCTSTKIVLMHTVTSQKEKNEMTNDTINLVHNIDESTKLNFDK